MKRIQAQGEKNNHGWGFAFLKKNQWQIIKKPESLYNENKLETITSKIIIGHVRLASCCNHTHKNTHPFERNNWVFAHNGTLFNYENLKLNKYKPDGETDSEYAFCYLLEKIEGRKDIKKAIEEVAEEIKKYGVFNFLLSDGKRLYAYGYDKLNYVERHSPFSKVKLMEDGYCADLSDIKVPDEKAIIIATEPLTEGEDWQVIKGLKVFEDI